MWVGGYIFIYGDIYHLLLVRVYIYFIIHIHKYTYTLVHWSKRLSFMYIRLYASSYAIPRFRPLYTGTATLRVGERDFDFFLGGITSYIYIYIYVILIYIYIYKIPYQGSQGL